MIRIAVAAGLVLLLAGCAATPQEDEGAFTLVVGDCFNLENVASVDAVPTIPCAEPHEFEAYASLRMDAATYPGETDTVAEADARCGQAAHQILSGPSPT